ncbi:MAG TPA: hypothetical protein VL728_07275 [Cyclobacteriaceae bacterium]|nr:hypothetical protein [Cyclobacteriaceae bacterium]
MHSISIYSQQFGSLLIVLLGIPFFSQRSLPIRIIVLYGINSFVFQIIGIVLVYSKGSGINVNGNLYTLTEALILLGFFYSVFNSPVEKKVVVAMSVIYVILYFVFMIDRWVELVSSIRTMRDLVIIICCIMYFFYLMREMPTNDITKYPMLWIVAAMLCFFAGTFTLSLSLNYLVKVLHNNLLVIWAVRNFFRLIFCLVVCYGLWLDNKRLRENLSLT